MKWAHTDTHPAYVLESPAGNIRAVVLEALGSLERVTRVCELYFLSTHPKFPILSEAKIVQGLPSLFSTARMDFVALCLCILLVQQRPLGRGPAPNAAPIYSLAKICVSSLEAAGTYSIEVAQSKLLIVMYEVGHGIFPAASVSMGSCARSVKYLGFPADWSPSQKLKDQEGENQAARWMAHNLDRYAAYTRLSDQWLLSKHDYL